MLQKVTEKHRGRHLVWPWDSGKTCRDFGTLTSQVILRHIAQDHPVHEEQRPDSTPTLSNPVPCSFHSSSVLSIALCSFLLLSTDSILRLLYGNTSHNSRTAILLKSYSIMMTWLKSDCKNYHSVVVVVFTIIHYLSDQKDGQFLLKDH